MGVGGGGEGEEVGPENVYGVGETAGGRRVVTAHWNLNRYEVTGTRGARRLWMGARGSSWGRGMTWYSCGRGGIGRGGTRRDEESRTARVRRETANMADERLRRRTAGRRDIRRRVACCVSRTRPPIDQGERRVCLSGCRP
jgi:hypothetical protein